MNVSPEVTQHGHVMNTQKLGHLTAIEMIVGNAVVENREKKNEAPEGKTGNVRFYTIEKIERQN